MARYQTAADGLAESSGGRDHDSAGRCERERVPKVNVCACCSASLPSSVGADAAHRSRSSEVGNRQASTTPKQWSGSPPTSFEREVLAKKRKALVLRRRRAFLQEAGQTARRSPFLEAAKTPLFTVWTNVAAEMSTLQADVGAVVACSEYCAGPWHAPLAALACRYTSGRRQATFLHSGSCRWRNSSTRCCISDLSERMILDKTGALELFRPGTGRASATASATVSCGCQSRQADVRAMSDGITRRIGKSQPSSGSDPAALGSSTLNRSGTLVHPSPIRRRQPRKRPSTFELGFGRERRFGEDQAGQLASGSVAPMRSLCGTSIRHDHRHPRQPRPSPGSAADGRCDPRSVPRSWALNLSTIDCASGTVRLTARYNCRRIGGVEPISSRVRRLPRRSCGRCIGRRARP